MTQHRRAKKAVRPEHQLARAMMEVLEERRLLTVMTGGDVFEFQQAPTVYVRAAVTGNTIAEFVGSTIDDQNQIILTDIPGAFVGGNRNGIQSLGGLGGGTGVRRIGTESITDLQGAGNFNHQINQPDGINFASLASNDQGDTYAINVGDFPFPAPPGGNQRTLVQLVQLDNATAAGTVRADIQGATLNEDTVAPTSQVLGTIGDVAIDPNTGVMYVVATPAGGTSTLYSLDRTTGAVINFAPIARVNNVGTTINTLQDIDALAFDDAGNLYFITDNYDGNPNVDSDNLPIAFANNPNPPPAVIPINSNNDDAIVHVSIDPASFGQFQQADLRSITLPLAGGVATAQHYTAMTWDAALNQFLAVAPQVAAAAGGQPATELQQVDPATGNAVVIGALGSGAGGVGGGTGTGVTISGLAFARNISDNPAGNLILVGLNLTGGSTGGGAGAAGGPQLVQIDPNTAAFTPLDEAGTVVNAGGLASYADPVSANTKPLLYTIAAGGGGNQRIVRGSAVSLPVDQDGKSTVTDVTAAEFDPINGRLYFISLEGDATQGANGGGGNKNYVLHTIDVNAGTRSDIQNSLTTTNGNFAQAQIDSMAFDRIGNRVTMWVVDNTSGKLGALAMAAAPADDLNTNTNGVAFSNAPINLVGQGAAGGGGQVKITGLAFWGDDPTGFLGPDPNNAEQFVYGINGDQVVRIRLGLNNPTALFWGSLPNPNLPTQPPRDGDDIQDITFNPNLLDPYTGRLGAVLGTDMTTDDLVYIDYRLRPASVDIFRIDVLQSNAQSTVQVYHWIPANPNVPLGRGTADPFGGSIGQLRVTDANGDFPPILVTAFGGTGIVDVGFSKTLDLSQADPFDDLRPLDTAAITRAFNSVPVGNGLLRGGIYVEPNLVSPLAPNVNITNTMLGQTITRAQGVSARADGTIAVVSVDNRVALVNPLAFNANQPVAITGAPSTKLLALDYGDPNNTGTETLYAAYLDTNGIAQLGTIDTTTGAFTLIGAIANGFAGIEGMAFHGPDLYVIDPNSILYQIDPASGQLLNIIGTVADLTGPLTISWMDFEQDTLIGIDAINGRLVDININNGQAGTVVATPPNSMPASIPAITWNALANRFWGVNNDLSGFNLNQTARLVELLPITSGTIPEVPGDIGQVLIGGATMGRVNVSGSMDLFYSGWLLTGDVGGQLLGAPDDPGNFSVGGELRSLITIDSIGTASDDAGAATVFNGTIYYTGFDLTAAGKVGQIITRNHLVGSMTVDDSPSAPVLGNPTGSAGAAPFLQHEIEGNGAGPFNFVGGFFDNGTFATAEYLGTISDPSLNTALHPDAGTNAIHVQGSLLYDPPNNLFDGLDFYSLGLLAGQSIVIQETNPLFQDLYVGVIDPDGRVVASDYSDVDLDAYHQHRFQFTAAIPGNYRIVMGIVGDGAFNLSSPAETFDIPHPYDLMITGAGEVALGGVVTGRNLFDARGAGTQIQISNGDLGAVRAGGTWASISTPIVQTENYAGAPEDALQGTTLNVDHGNIRALDCDTIGAGPGTGVNIDAFNGSVGLVQARTGNLFLNPGIAAFNPPRVSDHEDPLLAVSRLVAIRGDYQTISAGGTFYGAVLTNQAIGVIRAGNMASNAPSMIVANADQTGDDGIIDLIDVEGNLGTINAGGPAIITGPAGDLRYLFVRGATFRDRFFGSGFPPAPEETNFLPGESASLTDDSGASLTVAPVPGARLPFGATAPSLHIVTYGVRGSGGSAIVNIRSDYGVSIRGVSDDVDGRVEIGHIELNGAGTAPTPIAGGRLRAAPTGSQQAVVDISGTGVVDLYSVDGHNINTLSNNSKALDPVTGKMVYGEILNVAAESIGILSAGNLGIARHATAAAVSGLPDRTGAKAYPFDDQRSAIIAGEIVLARATGAMGNIIASPALLARLVTAGLTSIQLATAGGGAISQIVADADHKRDTGDFEGIVAPIWATGTMPDVTTGMGITSGGNGDLALSGLFANGAIGQVRGTNAHIYGPVVSTTSIANITLRDNSSIRGANIEVPTLLAGAREWVTLNSSGSSENINNPGYEIGTIFVDGTTHKKKKPVPINGGIQGTFIAAADINTIRTLNTFGIVDSAFGTIANGRINQFLVDGYGIRDTQITSGSTIGKIVVTGDGSNLPTTDFSAAERVSETSEFDPFTTFEPNRTTDLHVYMGTSSSNPTNPGTTNSGVIAGTTVKASRDLSLVQTWRVQPGIVALGSAPSDFDVANSIKTFTTRQDAENMQITTGGIGTMTIGRDLIGPSITVAGIFSNLHINRDYIPDTINDDLDTIRATGPNGQIKTIFIGRNMRGTISAKKKIGKVTVKGAFTGAIFQNGVQILP